MKPLRTILPAVLVAALLYLSIALVPAGHVGVVFGQASGVQEQELPEGLSFLVPLWQRKYNVDVRTQVFTYESFVQTKDLQEITLPVAINYHIDPARAAEVYQNVGPASEIQAKLIEPAAFQASTQAMGQVNAEDVAQQRAQLALSITDIIAGRLDAHGIIVEFVAVKDAVMDSAFIAAIQAKVIAEQNQQTALNNVEVARAEAEQARRRAEGIADANTTIEATLTEGILDYLWITKWNGITPATVVGDTSGVLVGID